MKRKLPGLVLLTVLVVLAGCRVASRGKDVVLAAATHTILFALDEATATADPGSASWARQTVPNRSKQCHKQVPKPSGKGILITRSV